MTGMTEGNRRIAICRLCYGAVEHPALGEWLAYTCHSIALDPRAGGLETFWIDQAPVYSARNLAVEVARDRKCDLLVTIDNDMQPDYVPGAPRFWDVAWEFWNGYRLPCVVSAPCCTAEGDVPVYQEFEDPDGKHLIFLHKESTVHRTGIERVPASTIALALIDMRCFDQLSPPYIRNR